MKIWVIFNLVRTSLESYGQIVSYISRGLYELIPLFFVRGVSIQRITSLLYFEVIGCTLSSGYAVVAYFVCLV